MRSARSASGQGPVGPGRRGIAGDVVPLRKRYTPARETFHARDTRARPKQRDVEGETVWLIVSTSFGPKGFWPPWRRSWRTAIRCPCDLAHLGFQSGDFILAIVALAFLQG